MSRPEYVTCIMRRPRRAWCGRSPVWTEFMFTGLEHATENAAQQGRLLACRQCADAAIATLQSGTEPPQALPR